MNRGAGSHVLLTVEDSLLLFSDGTGRKILEAGPVLDREAARTVAAWLYPDQLIRPIGDGELGQVGRPGAGRIYVASYPGLIIVCTAMADLDHPARLPRRVRIAVPAREVCVHNLGAGSFGYAIWNGGVLRRSLSVSGAGAIIEAKGRPLPFEADFPVAPGRQHLDLQKLGQAALRDRLGVSLEDPLVAALPAAGFLIA